jgi:hypothetical protein
MRLNEGLPVWHLSVSAQDPRRGPLDLPSICEPHAIRALAGVGGDREWWIWSPARIGHLRVAVTPEEHAAMPAGVALDDAGESGPERARRTP